MHSMDFSGPECLLYVQMQKKKSSESLLNLIKQYLCSSSTISLSSYFIRSCMCEKKP